MNYRTKEILKDAREMLGDEDVFSFDQIQMLRRMLDYIGAAIDKESEVNKPNVTM